MQQGKLTHAWITASAALPLEWPIMGVVRGPRGAEAPLPGDMWVAWAKGPSDGEELAGTGEAPHSALYRLAERLAERRGADGPDGS